MVEIKTKELVECFEALQEVSKKEFPARAAFKIARLMREINNEYQLYEKSRNDIVMRYVERDENGDPVRLDDERVKIQSGKMEECSKELNELMETTLNINVEKINLDEFGDNAIAAEQLYKMMNFIE